MKDVYNSIEEYLAGKRKKVLKVFGDMMAGMASNKKLHSRVTELFVRVQKLNLLLFINSYTSLCQMV